MKLSIITINYNNRAGLQKTIDSVICQTWRDFEWIVIDGGSTDGSKELIEKYHEHFSYWCSKPDKGIYNAMNKGVKHASGQYVNFLNSGDIYYSPNVLEDIFSHNLWGRIIVGHTVYMTDNAKFVYSRVYRENLVLHLYTKTISHQSSFIQRSLLFDFPYDEKLIIVSDWKFWIQTIVLRDITCQMIDTIVVVQEPYGLSSIKGDILQTERKIVLDELIPHSFQSLLAEYHNLRQSIIFRRVMYLKRNHAFLYCIVRMFLSVLLLLVGVNNKRLIEEENFPL